MKREDRITVLKNVKQKYFLHFLFFSFDFLFVPLHPQTKGLQRHNGALAQLVEHRTENPCVPGSIPGGTTPPFIMNPTDDFGLMWDFCFSHSIILLQDKEKK